MPTHDIETPKGLKELFRTERKPDKVTQSVNVEDEVLLAIIVIIVRTTVGSEEISRLYFFPGNAEAASSEL